MTAHPRTGLAQKTGVIVTFLASLVLGAPAHGGGTDYGSVHRVAIISKLGANIHVEKIGITAFGSSRGDLALDWNVDDYVRSAIATIVGYRFTIIASGIDPNIFDRPELFGHLAGEEAEKLKSVPVADRADAYIVVYPVEVLAGEPAGVVLSHDKEFFTQHTSLSAMYYIYVFDGRTGARLDYGTARIPANGHLGGYSIPVVDCGSDLWSDSIDQFTSIQKNSLKQEITGLLDRSLPFALNGAGLVTDSDAKEQYRRADQENSTCRPL